MARRSRVRRSQGATYTLVSFGSTDFCVADLTHPGQPPAGSVRYFVGGNPVGRSPLTNGVATLTLGVDMPAGAYAVTAQFTSANPPHLDAARAPAALDVSRENAAAAYTGDVALMTALPARWPAPADENCARPKRY